MKVEDFAILETLKRIEQHLIEIKEYITRDKLAEIEEQAELAKRYQMKRDIMNDLATQILRDGKINPRSLLEYSEKLNMDPDKLEKEAKRYLEQEQAKNL